MSEARNDLILTLLLEPSLLDSCDTVLSRAPTTTPIAVSGFLCGSQDLDLGLSICLLPRIIFICMA